MSEKQVLAVDYGASSGRVMLGGFDGASFTISELHRFPNDPVKLGDTMFWDVLRLFFEMKQGIVKSKAYGEISGIGVDTWALISVCWTVREGFWIIRFTTGMGGQPE